MFALNVDICNTFTMTKGIHFIFDRNESLSVSLYTIHLTFQHFFLELKHQVNYEILSAQNNHEAACVGWLIFKITLNTISHTNPPFS